MKSIQLILLAALVVPGFARADALFGNNIAGGMETPRTFGIGIDYFNLRQPFQLDSLTFVAPPGAPLPPISDPSVITADSEIQNFDVKVDVWLLPFLNVFGIYGRIDGDTLVDLQGLELPLPPQTQRVVIDYDGDVYGGGLVLAVGGERWFGSVTATFTDTDLSGDFESSVKATTIQPRIGLRAGDGIDVWVGGYIIDAEESHQGTVNLDIGFGLGVIPIDFAVDLSQKEDFNPSIGMHMMLGESWEATAEIGGGDRDTVLANFTYRFQ